MMTPTRTEVDHIKDLLWNQLTPNIPEINGMGIAKDHQTNSWYIAGRLEKPPTHEGQPIEMITEFMDIHIDWQIIGKIVVQ